MRRGRGWGRAGPAPSEGSLAGQAGRAGSVIPADALEPADLSARPICFPLGSRAPSLGPSFLQDTRVLAAPTWHDQCLVVLIRGIYPGS